MGIFDKLRNELVDIIEWVDDRIGTARLAFSPLSERDQERGPIDRPSRAEGDLRLSRPDRRRLRTRALHPQDRQPADLEHASGLEVRLQQPVQLGSLFRLDAADHRSQVGHAQSRSCSATPISAPCESVPSARTRSRPSSPRLCLKELVGTDGEFDADEVTELLRSIIVTAFGDLRRQLEDRRARPGGPLSRYVRAAPQDGRASGSTTNMVSTCRSC